jgi:hypothetical protein
LVGERFLHRLSDGTYVTVPRARPTPAKAALPSHHGLDAWQRRHA